MPFSFPSFLLCAEINLLSRFFLVSYLIILHELLLPWQSHPLAGVICTYFPFLGKYTIKHIFEEKDVSVILRLMQFHSNLCISWTHLHLSFHSLGQSYSSYFKQLLVSSHFCIFKLNLHFNLTPETTIPTTNPYQLPISLTSRFYLTDSLWFTTALCWDI